MMNYLNFELPTPTVRQIPQHQLDTREPAAVVKCQADLAHLFLDAYLAYQARENALGRTISLAQAGEEFLHHNPDLARI